MKKIWRPIAAAALASACISAAALAGQNPGLGADRGRFRILLGGRMVGTEDFTISRQGQDWLARSEIQLHLPGQAKETDEAALTLAADGSPIR
jgi:hypothetical protein